jgi:hypothetical protein
MRAKLHEIGEDSARAARIAWFASFVATIVVVAILALAKSAQALTLPSGNALPPAVTAPLEEDAEEAEEGEEPDEEGVEGESGSSDCEIGGEEDEEECEAEAEADEREECFLSSATATVSANGASNKVRLAIHYTAFSPTTVGIDFWLRGSKGPLSLGSDRDHLGRKGVLRVSETLSEGQMSKALAAKKYTVQLRPANAPGYCHEYLDRQLTVRHAAAGGFTWTDPELGYRASRQS